MKQTDLFAGVPPASRRLDLPTAKAAGNSFEIRGISDLHLEVLDAFEEYGRMTDEQLEMLPQFADYAPSTIRKRRSELYQRGNLKADGTRVNSRGRPMVVWTLGDPL